MSASKIPEAVMHLPAIELAVSSPTTCHANDSVASASAKMRNAHEPCLPVLDPDGRLVGLVTWRDLVRGIVCCASPAAKIAVAQVMTTELWTLPPEASVAEAVALMRAHHVRRVPLVAGRWALVGLISLDDLMRGRSRREAPSPVFFEEYARDQRLTTQAKAWF